jgi:SLT domain-containing protein
MALTPNRDTTTYLPPKSTVYSGAQTQQMLGANNVPQNNLPRFNGGTLGSAFSWASDKIGQGANWVKDQAGKGVNWLKDSVGDVMDWIDKPGKLLDKVLQGFGVDFSGINGGVIGDITKAAWKKIKDGATNWLKEQMESMMGGDGSVLDMSKLTYKYGYDPNYYAETGVKWHGGLDFGYINEAVPSTINGTANVMPFDGGGYGNWVKIAQGAMDVIYAHLSKHTLKDGEKVKVGDTVGISGNTGFSTGPHLHYEMRRNGETFNPLPWLKENNGGGASGKWGGKIKEALKLAGLPTTKSYINAWSKQIQTESGGNAKAIGGTDGLLDGRAKGLVQVKPGTFNSFKLPGHDNIFNGLDNLIAGMRYASARYGSSLLDVIGHGHGYASGGIINSPEIAWLAEGGFSESVISHDPSNKVKSQAIWKETGDKLGFSTEGETLQRIMKLIEESNETNETIEINTRNSGNNPIYLDNKKVGKQVAEPVKQEIENIERRNKRFNRR